MSAPVSDDGSQAFEADAHLLRRNWRLPLTSAVLGLCAYFMMGTPDPFLAVAAGYLLWMAASFTVLTVLRNAFRAAVPVRIHATEQALSIERRASIPTSEIAEVKATRYPGTKGDVAVDVTLRSGRKVTLWLRHAAVPALLQALGVGSGERRASFLIDIPLSRRFLAVWGTMTTAWVTLLLLTGAFGFASLLSVPMTSALVSFAGAVLAGAFKGRVVVGADGLSVRWLRRRFVPYSEVTGVSSAPMTTVTLRSGRRLRLTATDTPDTDAQRGVNGIALFRHLEAAYARYAARTGEAMASALVRRGGRSPRDWLAALDGLVKVDRAGYRTATVAPEVLAALARAADEPAEARVGAAAALVRIGADEHRVMVRVAAEACADPEARAALEGLAEAHTDEETLEALRAYGSEKKAHKRVQKKD